MCDCLYLMISLQELLFIQHITWFWPTLVMCNVVHSLQRRCGVLGNGVLDSRVDGGCSGGVG